VHFVVVGEDRSGTWMALRAFVGEDVVTGKGISILVHRRTDDQHVREFLKPTRIS